MGEHVIVAIEEALIRIISVSSLEVVMTDNTTSRLLSMSDDFPENQFLTASITLQNGVVTSNTIEIEFSK